jgi:hypothetical protein
LAVLGHGRGDELGASARSVDGSGERTRAVATAVEVDGVDGEGAVCGGGHRLRGVDGTCNSYTTTVLNGE